MKAYVARQPILDRKQRVYGYELLFRTSMENIFPDLDHETATNRLLSDSFLTVGLENLAGKSRAFVNFPENLLLEKIPLHLPFTRMVVEILETVRPTPALVEACRDMSDQGVRFALDDFVLTPDWHPLLEIANIVKFDVLSTPQNELEDMLNQVSCYPVRLLAEKVETHEEFQKYLGMGFEYFQGYFFSKPAIVQSTGIPPLKINLLAIMAKIANPNLSLNELEELIGRDAGISYKLLRYINSAYFATVQKISSIRHAVSLLGLDAIRRFTSLLMMNQLGADKPDELVLSSAIRARFCDLLGQQSGCKECMQIDLFTLGLFSQLDALLDETMENCLNQLPLEGAIKDALIKNTGGGAVFLELVKKYERGDWEAVRKCAEELCVPDRNVPACYLEAVEWARALEAP
ncbi:EAL and modified HD-GYP domain-containing signal transduction protein [Desulfatibacillum alkenivorans DSM 16219]|uniref:EAL and modified HD-GYP domain-containing signal transduction protein n=1 Tax=Desulfatibacillum alkenivorans DSM 16219 TaxID=1121393 RepID=A0A1M6X4W1_9BACT|nr:HDOD domain-containing protein [Desulfatibacillum alkenivorans]SHL00954.1 EAL and modified HD-GYP domain-containing signal transduction protein [Desulfatibacillum alkenivorans DSM 16219]